MIIVGEILSQSITLVYDTLDLGPNHIDRNKIRILPDATPVVMDTPDMLVVIYPTKNVFLQLGERRIRVIVQRAEQKIGTAPVWQWAGRLHGLVTRSNLVAYGFNYDVRLTLPKDASTLLVERFAPEAHKWVAPLGAEFRSFIPRIKYARGETLYDLILDPLDTSNVNDLKAHLNVHFASGEFPAEQTLEASYRKEYALFEEGLQKLLKT
jgi:hypothetical protein